MCRTAGSCAGFQGMLTCVTRSLMEQEAGGEEEINFVKPPPNYFAKMQKVHSAPSRSTLVCS